MKKTLKDRIYLSMLTVFYMLLISGGAQGQNISDTSLILKKGRNYEYQNGLYKKRELRSIIFSSLDPEAIRYYKKFLGYKIAGPSLIVCGGITALYGLYYQLGEEAVSDLVYIFSLGTEEPEPSNTGNVIAGIGAGMVGLGIIFTVAAGPAFQRSIQRFNSVRIGDQHVQVNLLTGQESLGIRLVWQIKPY